MSKLREAAQAVVDAKDNPLNSIEDIEQVVERLRSALAQPPAAPDAEVRTQHKEFARWFLELGDKSALASEYLAWLAWKAALAHPPRDEWREAAEEALRWMEHARLHLTIKERMHPDGLSLYDSAAEALRAALAKPVADAPRDEWRPASEPPDSTRSVLIWLKFGDVETFGKTLGGPSGFAFQNGAITHWRDIEPPEQEGE